MGPSKQRIGLTGLVKVQILGAWRPYRLFTALAVHPKSNKSTEPVTKPLLLS